MNQPLKFLIFIVLFVRQKPNIEVAHLSTAEEDNGVDRATNNLTGGTDADLAEEASMFNSLEPEPVVDEEISHNIVIESVDANEQVKSALFPFLKKAKVYFFYDCSFSEFIQFSKFQNLYC